MSKNNIKIPISPRPYTIVVKGRNTVYGLQDMTFVERIEKAQKADQARHIVEWLEYDLMIAKQDQKKAYDEIEELRNSNENY